MTLPQFKMKIHMNLSAESDMFLLYINQIDFFDLPYKFDLTQESDSTVKYQALVKFED